MKLTHQPNKDQVKNFRKKEQIQRKQKFLGKLKPKKGHKIWCFNMSTGELTLAKFEKTDVDFLAVKNNEIPKNRKIQATENCIYFSALNVGNAIKKLEKKYNLKFEIL